MKFGDEGRRARFNASVQFHFCINLRMIFGKLVLLNTKLIVLRGGNRGVLEIGTINYNGHDSGGSIFSRRGWRRNLFVVLISVLQRLKNMGCPEKRSYGFWRCFYRHRCVPGLAEDRFLCC